MSLAIFHILAFSILKERSISFWINYGFMITAFLIQAFIFESALGARSTLKSKFLGFPLIYVGLTYWAVQLLLFIVFSLISHISPWIPLVTEFVVLGLTVIFLIITQIGRSEVSQIDDKINLKRSMLIELETEIELLSRNQSDYNLKAAINELGEKIRFSDPMSSSYTLKIDDEIKSKVESLKNINSTELITTINEVETLIIRRNSILKTYK